MWQASVNPKAETVEELQGRRKKLHMGMCKLLEEDLALLAEARLADDSAAPGVMAAMTAIKERIKRDFDDQTRVHEMVDADEFNRDEKYKRLMNEAIDGKAYALQKMQVYLESIAEAMPQPELQVIFNAPLAHFASEATVLRLRTGIMAFPWEKVVQERSADIDLGEWNAASASAQARELASGALGGNPNVRSVLVMGVELALSRGWETTYLRWSSNAAVMALPVTVSLVLRNCRHLDALDIRCSGVLGAWLCIVSRQYHLPPELTPPPVPICP